EFSPKMYLECWRNAAAGLLMFALLLLFNRIFPAVSYLWILLRILAGAVLYFLFLFLLRDPFLQSTARSVRAKISRKKTG
ncbi:MAG: hypothetical protein J6Z79_02400, partial [Clostridia bacterium]|nr:hypothetical protein [Clostridia bacterium]